jgi:hypothetical protein
MAVSSARPPHAGFRVFVPPAQTRTWAGPVKIIATGNLFIAVTAQEASCFRKPPEQLPYAGVYDEELKPAISDF